MIAITASNSALYTVLYWAMKRHVGYIQCAAIDQQQHPRQIADGQRDDEEVQCEQLVTNPAVRGLQDRSAGLVGVACFPAPQNGLSRQCHELLQGTKTGEAATGFCRIKHDADRWVA